MRKTIAAVTLALLTTPLVAQKPTEVTIKQVNDRRTNGSFARLTLSLELPKIRTADVAASRVLVASATDDSGRDVRETDASEPQLEVNHRMGMADEAAAPVVVSVALKNPDRKATTLKEVRGEIELYMPSKDANSVAEIPKFLSSSGKALSHRALKANGVDIALISTAQIDAEKKRLGDAKRKEYKESGWQDGEDLESMVTSSVESVLKVDEGEILTRIKDPNKRIHEIVYVDAAGEEKRVSTYDREGFTVLSTWSGKPQPDWKLRVSMKTPKNLVRHTFAINNVPLP